MKGPELCQHMGGYEGGGRKKLNERDMGILRGFLNNELFPSISSNSLELLLDLENNHIISQNMVVALFINVFRLNFVDMD